MGRSRRFAELHSPLCASRSAWQSRARAGRDASLRRSAAPTTPAVLGPMASSPTHCANCVRSVQTVATKSVHEARCARWPWALRSSAPHRRIVTCPARLCGSARGVRPRTNPATTSRRAAPGRGDLCGDEERSARVGARSALRDLTRRYCLSVAPATARSELSARPRHEHRSGVGAKRRPPQHEPLAGAAWRDAPNHRKSGPSSTAAMSRMPQPESGIGHARSCLSRRGSA